MEALSENSEKSGLCRVNKKLLPVKVFFFFSIAGKGVLLPFLPLYLKQLRITSSENGIIYGVMSFASFFSRPIFGAVADRWQCHRLTLATLTLLGLLFYLFLLAVPARQVPGTVVHTQLHCGKRDAYLAGCDSSAMNVSDHDSTCRLGLSELADFISMAANTSTGAMDGSLDCNLQCSDIGSLVNENGSVCFTDANEQFTKYCNGTIISELPLMLKLSNISYLWSKQIPPDGMQAESGQCKNFSIHSFQLGGRKEMSYGNMFCDKETAFACNMTCLNSPLKLCQNTDLELDWTFGWVFVLLNIAYLVYVQSFPLSYTIAFSTMGPEGRHIFGKQRVWGSIGFTFATAFLLTMSSRQSAPDADYTVNFYSFAALCCASIIVAPFLAPSSIRSVNVFQGMAAVGRMRHALLFLFTVTVMGMLTSVLDSFLFWYLNDLGASKLIINLCLAMDSVLEIPLMAVSPYLIKRLGAAPCLYIALFAHAVQFGSLSLIGNPWLSLLIEPLQSVTHMLFWTGMAVVADQIAPPGTEATMQGLVNSLSYGIGMGVGSFLTGFLFDVIGGRLTFIVYSIVAASVLIIYCLGNHFVFRSHSYKKASVKASVTIVQDVKSDWDDIQPNIRTKLLGDRERTKLLSTEVDRV